MRIRQLLLAFAIFSSLCPLTAVAQKAACTEAYEKAQEEKASGQFKAALVHLRACVDTECPKFIREDCAHWMDQVETALPTVVFAIRRDGVDQSEVDVTCDGAPLTRFLDGKAIPLDPGMHRFLFTIAGVPPAERQLLIREGERSRIIQVDFQTPRQETSASGGASLDAVASTAQRDGGPGYLTYGLAGAGVLGVANFALFAILGSSQQGDLEKSCSPNCRSSQVESVRTKYLIADVSLGVGLASLGIATYLYFTDRGKAHSSDEKHATSIGLVPQPTGQGGLLQLSTIF
jgi:hypothetical protein